MVNGYEMLRDLKRHAQEEKIPIMNDEGIDFLTTFVLKNQITNVLEIGTAVGFSAISMALMSPRLKITTIERDENRYLEAVQNIKDFQLEDRITIIFNDALETKVEGEFDLIFIDAAKGQNRRFFERFENNLRPHGFIITDNMKFHGYVDKDESEIKSHNLRGLVRKIKDYRLFLEENANYETTFYDLGDGVAVSMKKN